MRAEEIVTKILELRGVSNTQEFFNSTHPKDIKSPFDSQPAIDLIKKHISLGNKIAVYGDYDVDGICGTATLWEALYASYSNVFPHIPHRESEGYGLSIKGIDHCLSQGAKLIITIDNGIVAHDQVKYIKDHNCDVIVVDHHEPEEKLPNADYILHSTNSCATGLAWFFARDYLGTPPSLELPAIATVCDLVPLIGINRSFVKYGLVDLNKTQRLGLIALFADAGLTPNSYRLTPYHLGYMIGPRINAMGRLEHAIDSLRLLCTKNAKQAGDLAKLLGETNKQRQDETKTAVDHALGMLDENNLPDLIVVSDAGYHPGVIGLIAGKLTEKYHRPSIAISVGEIESKASCRSVSGFHITDHLRQYSDLLVAVGGHAAAAGFTVSNSSLPKLLKKLSETSIDPKLLKKTQRVDLEIPLESVTWDLVLALQRLEPFGLGNPSPVFSTPGVEVSDVRPVGKDNKHFKFQISNFKLTFEAIWFNGQSLSNGKYNIIYQIEENNFNGNSSLQLNVRMVEN